MMLFIVFALVVVIATGIPYVKKGIENRKLMKEYMEEQGLGKNEAIGKVRDAKTTNDKVIEGLFYLSLIALLGGGFYNIYLYNNENSDLKKPYVIFLTPQGKQLTHKKVTELSEKEEIVLISGRYEGLDQRVIDKFVDEEISIGDYVLSSGDLPCLVIMDSVIRIKEGVIKKESFETDSFYNGLLGFPQYTRPVEIDGYSVPEVLRSGNHAKIDEYRQFHSIEKTMKNRMDLFEKKLAEDEEFLKLCEKYKLKLK